MLVVVSYSERSLEDLLTTTDKMAVVVTSEGAVEDETETPELDAGLLEDGCEKLE